MNILVIKHSSLGDVLHATGHLRTIKENFPGCQLTVVTSKTSYDILRYNKYIDKIVLFEKERAKREWKRNPRWVVRHLLSLFREVRHTQYDVAFDLQGRLKSVVFLYAAKASRKYVKGRWLFLKRVRKPEMHAIEEMDQVLRIAGLHVDNSTMEIFTSSKEEKSIERLLKCINPGHKKILIVSPFTRWNTKNWGLEKFMTVINNLQQDVVVVCTGVGEKKNDIDRMIVQVHGRAIVNLAGELTLLELAELIKRSDLLLTGDSFPMHVASAFHVPVIALFGPTDEKRVGPVGHDSTVLRADDRCVRCYERDHCRRACMSYITPETVLQAIHHRIGVSKCPR